MAGENPTRLKDFGSRLRELMSGRDEVRPFICDGDPYECRAFVVGFNPASKVPFSRFWNDDTGFDKGAWFEEYKAQRISGRRPTAVSPTRQRIEDVIMGAHPIRVLETNLYDVATKSEAALAREHRDPSIFEFLLRELQPHVLLLHGKKVRIHFDREFGSELNESFQEVQVGEFSATIAAVKHLSRGTSRETTIGIGQRIKGQILQTP
jgi:hypothetical protein